MSDNRENFQGRYLIQRPLGGALTCERAEAYVAQVRERHHKEAETLAHLTGWSLVAVRAKMSDYAPSIRVPDWWERGFCSLLSP